MKKIIIAIDGPAGAGKSTVAQKVAQQLQYLYIDTGAMYRAITWLAVRDKIPKEQIAKIAHEIDIVLKYIDGKFAVIVNGRDVSEEIRIPEVTGKVAEISQIPEVRNAMVKLQQRIGSDGGVVMDGRDIGTHVFPKAEVKIFLTASIEERAKRRWLELQSKNIQFDLQQLQREIAERDKKDSERLLAPLIQAPDAVVLDTTCMTIEQSVAAIVNIFRERTAIV